MLGTKYKNLRSNSWWVYFEPHPNEAQREGSTLAMLGGTQHD